MPGRQSTFPTGAALLVAATMGTGCTVTLDSKSQIVREEKRFTELLRIRTGDGSIRLRAF